MSAISNALADMAARAEELKLGMTTLIRNCPDNPRIKPLGDSGRCFVIMLSDLTVLRPKMHNGLPVKDDLGKSVLQHHTDWTPECHNFKYQYEQLAKEIEKRDLTTVEPFLMDTLAHGKWWDRSQQCNHTLHPEAVENLKTALKITDAEIETYLREQKKRGKRGKRPSKEEARFRIKFGTAH